MRYSQVLISARAALYLSDSASEDGLVGIVCLDCRWRLDPAWRLLWRCLEAFSERLGSALAEDVAMRLTGQVRRIGQLLEGRALLAFLSAENVFGRLLVIELL